MRETMCKAMLVLETIKKTKGRGGMTSAQLQLAEAQSEDYQTMKKELREIKTDMTDLKNGFSGLSQELGYVKGRVDMIVDNMHKKGFFELMLEMISKKGFWALLIIASTLYLCGQYGINVKDVVGLVKSFFTGG